MEAPPVTIALGSELANDYLASMELAGAYAYAGRDWVVDRVLRILGATGTVRVHNDHNFAWWEEKRWRPLARRTEGRDTSAARAAWICRAPCGQAMG